MGDAVRMTTEQRSKLVDALAFVEEATLDAYRGVAADMPEGELRELVQSCLETAFNCVKAARRAATRGY